MMCCVFCLKTTWRRKQPRFCGFSTSVNCVNFRHLRTKRSLPFRNSPLILRLTLNWEKSESNTRSFFSYRLFEVSGVFRPPSTVLLKNFGWIVLLYILEGNENLMTVSMVVSCLCQSTEFINWLVMCVLMIKCYHCHCFVLGFPNLKQVSYVMPNCLNWYMQLWCFSSVGSLPLCTWVKNLVELIMTVTGWLILNVFWTTL